MELTFQTHGAWTLVKAKGRIEAKTSQELEANLNSHLDKDVNQLAVDLEEVDYVSSAGLRVLLSTLKRLGKQGGKMVLVHPHEYVMEVLRVSGFLSLFVIVDNVNELD